MRDNPQVEGMLEPDSGDHTKISLFADDAAIILGKPSEQTKDAREEIRNYERMSASAVHEGKTMLMTLGSTSRAEHTSEELGVQFKILGSEAKESYLGDLIGQEVTEEERFDEGVKNMKT